MEANAAATSQRRCQLASRQLPPQGRVRCRGPVRASGVERGVHGGVCARGRARGLGFVGVKGRPYLRYPRSRGHAGCKTCSSSRTARPTHALGDPPATAAHPHAAAQRTLSPGAGPQGTFSLTRSTMPWTTSCTVPGGARAPTGKVTERRGVAGIPEGLAAAGVGGRDRDPT